jgi:cholesterol oxidase
MSRSVSTLGRRRFLGLSAGGALAGLTASTIGLAGTGSAAAAAGRTSFPAIVIGSGFGGSVAALRLGQAGVDTLVLERGRQWPVSTTQAVFGSQDNISNKMFWYRGTADWPLVPPAPMTPAPGVMEVSNEPNLDIACGAAVGGGSIVYTGVTVAPPRQYFQRLYPQLSYDEFLTTWYPKVCAMLGVSPMPADIYNSAPFTHSRVWDKHRAAAGYPSAPLDSIFDWDVLRQELAGTVRSSACAGETDFGCSDGAKKSLTRNYLPAAMATGHVSLQALAEVATIGRSAGRWQVVVTQRGDNGATLSTDTYTCDKLFVCAGTLNTNRLLVAARDSGALPALPASIGTGFGDNGDQYSGYSYLGDPAGPAQGAACASGTFHDTGFALPMRAESWQLLGLHGLPALMTLTMTADFDNRGTFSYNPLTKRVSLADWTTAKSQPAADAAAALNTKVCNAAPGAVPIPVVWPFTLTAHPLGGVQIGRSTDWAGRVNGYPGLYVLDGALIPGTVGGANPSLSIAALAERCIAQIIAAGG